LIGEFQTEPTRGTRMKHSLSVDEWTPFLRAGCSGVIQLDEDEEDHGDEEDDYDDALTN
jgi:hypothetical protein